MTSVAAAVSRQRGGRLRRRLAPYAMSGPAVALLVLFFLVPLGIMVLYSFYTRIPSGFESTLTVENYQVFFETGVYREVLWATLRLAGITTVVTLATSFPLAYWLARSNPRWLTLALFALVLSFWTSVVIRSFAWLVVLGQNGIVNDTFGLVGLGPFRLIYNEIGVVIGLVHVMIPYMVFPLYVSLRAIDPSVEQAAEGLGASPWRRFLRITLPLSLPGLLGGSVLIFIITSGFFLTPALLGGGRVPVVATFVQQQVGLLNYPFASVLSVVLLVVVLTIVSFFHRLVGVGRLARGFDAG